MDFLIVLAGWFVFHYLHTELVDMHLRHVNIDFVSSGILLSTYWVIIFIVSGLYKKLYLVSRLDEFFKVFKSSIIGALILYFVLDFSINDPYQIENSLMLTYWSYIFGITSLNRFLIRTVQRFYARRGEVFIVQ